MLIEEVERRPVQTVQAFRTAISKVASGKPILLLVRLGNANQFIVIRKP
ncbi:MAG: hypothetical protein GWO39_02830 [Gammaproteobacteria bacterium]|nr:hypothetical protein [Gammaproteobacteria bacterium]NIT62759.1 hypothetical protein [Gammaproteobacteria bacterium]NIV19718.1 hypothetical protein [Gammaproteobacteria bacterium]NIY31339.1 hypothetical protein [Gammaproteobacteria bacterium]